MSKKGKTDTRVKEASKYYKDEPVLGQAAEEVLSFARIQLLREQPFFGNLAQYMSFYEMNMFPTTAVTPKGVLLFNRKWVNGWSVTDAQFEFGHEVMHLVQRCFDRFPEGGNHQLWNKAADWVADTTLIDAGFTQSEVSKEAVGPFEQAMVRKLGGTIEAVYQYLLENDDSGECAGCKHDAENVGNENNSGSGGENGEDGEGEGEGEGEGSGPPHTCGNVRMCCAGTSADLGEDNPLLEQEWIEKIIASKMFAESRGNMPGALGDSIDSLTKSTVRWQDYLRTKAIKIYGRDRYTFKRYPRRTRAMGNNIRLPRAQPEGKTAVIACDTSGSMSQEMVIQSISEAAEIMLQCGASKIFLILHDYVVYYAGEVSSDMLTKLKMSRGGTSHHEVFSLLNGEKVNDFEIPKTADVELAVLFTDLGTSFPNHAPACDVIWAVPSIGYPGPDANVPFGQKVIMDMGPR